MLAHQHLGGGFIGLCIVNAQIKGVPPENRASLSIIDYARVNKATRKAFVRLLSKPGHFDDKLLAFDGPLN